MIPKSVYVMDGPNQGHTAKVEGHIIFLVLEHPLLVLAEGRRSSLYKRKEGTDEFYWMEKQAFPRSRKEWEKILKSVSEQ